MTKDKNGLSKHESVRCPRCGTFFECKPGVVHLCQCFHTTLTRQEADYIKSQYEGCLCARCLNEMKEDYRVKSQALR